MTCPPCTQDCEQGDTCPGRTDDTPPRAEMVVELFTALNWAVRLFIFTGAVAFAAGYFFGVK